MGKIIKFVAKIPSRVAVEFINLYQKTLSPDHGWLKLRFPHGYCKFYPSCSEYSKQAITKHGLIKGGFMGLLRIVKCNPFSEPKIDSVPKYNH
jgi:putative membrane protein insertion efficiency factor